MKYILCDISISEMRDFMGYMEKCGCSYIREFSFMSLKLRIQFLMQTFGVKDMKHLLNLISLSDGFKENVMQRLCFKHAELFRDAEVWKKIEQLVIQSEDSEKLMIYVVDTPDASDLLTLLIMLHEAGLHDRTEIRFLCFKGNNPVSDIFPSTELTQRQLLQTQDLYSTTFMKKHPLVNYFTLSGNVYKPSLDLLQSVECSQFPFDSEHYPEPADILIARNLTIGFNIPYHEKLFSVFMKLIKRNGVMVFGLRESFSWCRNYVLVQMPDNVGFYYNKTR